jgi:hypothetical protein
MKTKFLFIGTLVALMFAISCNSDDKPNDNTTAAITTDQIKTTSKIDASIEDVTNIAEDQFTAQQNTTSKPSGTVKNFLPSCATITTVLTGNTWTRTVDFGAEGCTLGNGNMLKGKIILSFSNDFTAATTTISYTFDGFYHNGKKLQGNRTITLSSKSTDLLATAHPVSTSTVDITITFEDGTIYTRKGTFTKEMIAGFDTWFDWDDNVFVLTGNGTTTFPNGDTLSTEITSPLEFHMSCHSPFPVKGIMTITKNGATATIDYGNGTCDSLATVTKDGVTEEIDLKK